MEEEIYQVLKKHNISPKKRESMIVDLLNIINNLNQPNNQPHETKENKKTEP
jgi:hypothetical protein